MKCLYRSCGKSRTNYPGLIMYSFPIKDAERCKKWIENSGNPVDVPISQFEFKTLCQFHFIEEDFVNAAKRRLIKAAIPCHFNDPQGVLRKIERKKEFGGNEGDSKIQRKPFHFLKSNLILDTRKKLTPQHITGHVIVRNDLYSSNQKKQLIERKDTKRRYLKRIYNRHDLQIPANKLLFQWLSDLREKRASNRDNISYYVNIDDVLTAFDSSNFFDIEKPWHEKTDTEKTNLKCYSRRNQNNGSPSPELCQKIERNSVNVSKKNLKCYSRRKQNESSSSEICQEIQRNSVSVSQTVSNEDQKLEDDNCENRNPSSVPNEHFWSSENVDKGEIHNQIASECELSEIDVKEEEISEYQIHWSEENEDDKSSIKILDVPKLRQEHFADDKSYSQSTTLKRQIRRKRFINCLRNKSETEKYIYMINKNRILINKLKRKLRTCYKELKILKKNQVCERNEDKKT